MGIVDFILNLAGLLLWLNWRSTRFDPLIKRLPATLMGTLRPATAQRLRPWHLPLFLAGLLLLRAVIYWWIGSAVNWTARLDMGVMVLSFRSDWFGRILTYSFASFGLALGILYLVLLFLSLLAGPDPIQRLVKIPLGRVDGWPKAVKIILPFVITAPAWWLACWWLAWLQIIPHPASPWERIADSLVIGLRSYLVWKFPAAAILILHLLSSYIYFGTHPLWNYVRTTARTLLQPLDKIPLRVGRVDFAPIVAVAVLFFAAELAAHGLDWLYARHIF